MSPVKGKADGMNTTAENNASFLSLGSKGASLGGPANMTLSQMSQYNGNPAEDITLSGSPVKALQIVRKSGLAGEIEDKETTNFMKLMDYLAD